MQHLRHGYAAEDARLRGREKRLEEELRQSELRHRQVQPRVERRSIPCCFYPS